MYTETKPYDGSFKSAISRSKKVLIAAGFPWSVTKGRYTPFFNEQKTSVGVRVTRIGCSRSVSVQWHGASLFFGEAAKWERQMVLALAVQTLREAGLDYDERGWLDCTHE